MHVHVHTHTHTHTHTAHSMRPQDVPCQPLLHTAQAQPMQQAHSMNKHTQRDTTLHTGQTPLSCAEHHHAPVPPTCHLVPHHSTHQHTAHLLHQHTAHLLHQHTAHLLHQHTAHLLHQHTAQLLHQHTAHLLHQHTAHLLHQHTAKLMHQHTAHLLHQHTAQLMHQHTAHLLHQHTAHSPPPKCSRPGATTALLPPLTMSSASTPCRPKRRRNASQLMPSCWYGRSWTAMGMGSL